MTAATLDAATTAAADAIPPRRWSRRVAVDIVALFDVMAVASGIVIPAAIYLYSGDLQIRATLIAQTSLISAIIVHSCLGAWGLYDTASLHDLPIRPGRLALSLVIALVAVLGIGLPFETTSIHLWIWYASWISASFFLLFTSRLAANAILKSCVAAGRFETRVAVFGAGLIARRVHDDLMNGPEGIRFVGVFDDRKDDDRIDPEGLEIAGKLDDLVEAARRGRVDQIVIALPQVADQRIVRIARTLERLPVSLHIVTHIASDLVEASRPHKVSSLGRVGLIDVKPKPLADWAPMIKRGEDYLVATLLLLVVLPLLPLIALAIKLETPGPVLFRQRRRGLNCQVFEVLKFRTMTVLEDGPDVTQAARADPRVTRVGAILRRTSLDELPQLINVLRGEMSLVGPRPHALAHDDAWGAMLERYANRHQVKPGITGLAQVRGMRGEVKSTDRIQARVDSDLDYIARWSLWLDLKILWLTSWAILSGRNAH